MGTSDILLGLVALGAALTVLYLVSEFMSWQTIKNAEVQTSLMLREMYKKLHARTKPFLERRKKVRPASAD
jgi:hypothetical protein